MTEKDEITRQRNKDSAQRAALFWIKLTNERESEIVRQLLALAAIILPLSASILLANITLLQIEKVLLMACWILLFVSIIAGFIQIIIDTRYFLKVSRDSSIRERLWSSTNRSIKDIDNDIVKLGEIPGSSGDWSLIIQGVAFFLAILLLLAVGFSIITQQHLSPSTVCLEPAKAPFFIFCDRNSEGI
ncbi:MAG: hypothetical protein M1484_02270 [Patescibacteria group bacterium]|nr:hypothetical protein [Patescibacteria group bacterium]